VNDKRRDDRPVPDEPATDPVVPRDTFTYVPGGPVARPFPNERGPEDPRPEDDADAALVDRMDARLETPRLRPAVLGRLEGLGLIITVRDAEGTVVRRDGTWRPGDETVTLEELQRTFPAGSTVTFTGTRVDARDAATAEDVSMEVVIERHAEYEQYDGQLLRIVNFSPRQQA
jgi:hypothetical protein